MTKPELIRYAKRAGYGLVFAVFTPLLWLGAVLVAASSLGAEWADNGLHQTK